MIAPLLRDNGNGQTRTAAGDATEEDRAENTSSGGVWNGRGSSAPRGKEWETSPRREMDIRKGRRIPSGAGRDSVMVSPSNTSTKELLGNEQFGDAVLDFLRDTPRRGRSRKEMS